MCVPTTGAEIAVSRTPITQSRVPPRPETEVQAWCLAGATHNRTLGPASWRGVAAKQQIDMTVQCYIASKLE